MNNAINKYRTMWIFVYFDLPTTTKKERKAYTDFRRNLMKDGFRMVQYSIYSRHCASRENAEVHKKRVKSWLPEYGNIMLFEITDMQYSRIQVYLGTKKVRNDNNNFGQLTIF